VCSRKATCQMSPSPRRALRTIPACLGMWPAISVKFDAWSAVNEVTDRLLAILNMQKWVIKQYSCSFGGIFAKTSNGAWSTGTVLSKL
jgi:hypothetical protein